MQVWNTADGSLIYDSILKFFDEIDFGPDDAYLVAYGERPRRWDTKTWSEMPTWGGTRESTNGQSFPVGPLAFSADRAILATVHGELVPDRYIPAIHLRDSTSGEAQTVLRCRDRHPEALAFSPNGRNLVSLHGPTIRVWDIANGENIVTHKVGTKFFQSLAFSPDGRWLLTVSNDTMVRCWDTKSWSEREGYAWKIGKLLDVAFSPDGLTAAAAGSSGKIVIWDVDL
jgi:WD40 repeat protein